MPEIVTTRTLYPDSIEIGTPGKGGCMKIHFDSSDLSEAQKRIENACSARQYLLTKLSQGGSIT
jgi:hypothetical protein